MPSFRAALDILGLRPGYAPEQVMESAVQTIGLVRLVEANQLDLIGGVPRLSVRFLVESSTFLGENDDARSTAASMHSAVDQVGLTGALRVSRRVRGRWEPV